MITAGLTLAALILALSIALMNRRICPGNPMWWTCSVIVVAAFAAGRWM